MKEFSTKKYFTCPFLGSCSGCEVIDNLFRPPSWKETLLFFKKIGLKLEIPLYSNGFENVRNKTKLAVRESGGLKIGLFKKNTHDVFEILNCPLHNSLINDATKSLKTALEENKVLPYSEKNDSGSLRYLQIMVTQKNKMSIVFVLNRKDEIEIERIKKAALSLSIKENCSFWINFQTEKTNVIFGIEWLHFWGENFLWQKLGAINVAFHPACFSQANLDLFERLILEIKSEAKGSRRILELYAGCGAIGLNLAGKEREVLLVEQNPYAKISYDETKKKNFFSNVTYLNENVNEVKNLPLESDLIIVDPPRKGIDEQILRALKEKKEGMLFYISCSDNSFKKDALELLKDGWKIKKVSGYLFFPGTNHIEIFSVFEKQ